jgi:ACR3 family arsenite efflux pump ArsB
MVACTEASIIKRRRKTVRLYHCLFIGFLMIPVMIQLVAWVFSPDRPTMWYSLVQGGLLAMTQLPNIIMHHVSLSKFDTIVAMWLYTDTDETDQPPGHTDAQLAELVASGL